MPIDSAPRVKTFSFTELYKHIRQPDTSIISEKILKEGALLVVGGAPKSYKSFVLLAIAVSLATGRNLFGAYRSNHGRPVKVFNVDKPRRVLFFEQEIGEDDLEDRIAPLYESLAPHEQELFRQNFFSHSLDGSLRFDTADGMRELERIVKEVRPDVGIFDPLIEFHDQDENSPTAMATMLKNFTRLCRRTHFTPIISHHEGKDHGDSGRDGGSRLRGASSLFGKGDTFINLRVVNKNAMRIQVEFTLRRGKPIKDMIIKLDPDTLEARFLCWQGDKLWKQYRNPVDEDKEPLETMAAAGGKQ